MAYLVLCAFFGLSTGLIGRIKGSSFLLWFLIGAVLPMIGLIGALLFRTESAEPHRECPGCGRVVPLHDALCTRCGTELEFPEAPDTPSAAEPAER